MTTITLKTPVGQLVAERPARSRIFEELGIDYCCGGRRSLGDVCESKGLDSATVLYKLATSDDIIPQPKRSWTEASLTELVDHIEHKYHSYAKTALPRLTVLIDKVNRAHGADDGRLRELRVVFAAFKADFHSHMSKEEQILFPLCRKMDSPESHTQVSVDSPIAAMMEEHDDAGAGLARMRALTDDFTAPDGACNTYRAMLQALEEFEADTHRHVHIENNVLFVKALEAEKSNTE